MKDLVKLEIGYCKYSFILNASEYGKLICV